MSDRATLSEIFSSATKKTRSITSQRSEERRKASREELRMKQRREFVEKSPSSSSSTNNRTYTIPNRVNLDSVIFDGSAQIQSRNPRHKPVVVLAPQIKKQQERQRSRKSVSSAPPDKGLKQIRVVFGGPIVEPPSHARRRERAQRRENARRRSERQSKDELDKSLDQYMRG